MTILAGVMSVTGAPLAERVVGSLRGLVSRNPAHAVQELRRPGVYLAKVDLGVYGSPALREAPSGSLAILAGHPVLAGVAGARAEHVTRLQDALDRGDWSVLERARGTWCAAHVDPAGRTLSLITDRVGVRPLYYWVGPDLVVFASALRVLEGLDVVPKVMDLRGVTELVSLGYPLGRRTPYADIRTLHSGEVAQVRDGALRLRRYWAWDRAAVDPGAAAAAPARLRQLFEEAVRDRLGSADRATAFLSGGLDSRSIVAVLRSQNVRVRTFNFYRFPRSQDAVLAERAAQALGCDHLAVQRIEQEVDFIHMLGRTLAAEASGPGRGVPATVWAGDGGSVGLGLVYVDADIVRDMRGGRDREALATFFGRYGSPIPIRVLRPAIARTLAEIPFEGARAELAALPDAEPGRRFHLFLLVNDQRRHLAAHFEDIDLAGLELQLPFFDADFLSAVLTVPVDESLGHALYQRWFDALPPLARSVPWQTYPGHVPCPLPIPADLAGQWDQQSQRFLGKARRRSRLRELWRIARASPFPDTLLSRGHLWAYLAAYQVGVADYGWVASTAAPFHRYWRRCAGRYALPPLAAS